MLSLSLTTGYAIKALSCLESGDCSTHFISDIARCANVPRPYLAKIINGLSRAGLVTTKRGYCGGITLARPAGEISLLEIVEAIEGKEWIGDCLLGMDTCSDSAACSAHNFWKRIRQEITSELRETSLAAVISSKRSGGARTKKSRRTEPAACACSQTVPA